jgi:4a-hydroxytetrahydrobiopterin dehydratase
LEKSYQFAGFADAISFMMRVSFECEKIDHHPAWTNIYSRVNVKLTTHHAGNTITDKDRNLAKIMDEIFKAFAPNAKNER